MKLSLFSSYDSVKPQPKDWSWEYAVEQLTEHKVVSDTYDKAYAYHFNGVSFDG